ncbi:TOBE domain-containing protein [Amphritea balenae]|uniref:LysR family transcriptional regulator n=1 Tax=Amphritea balenae TaxID=452629 RepID=A0A3P1SVN5_9GAMM|nr:TOBE domain-containing protein [Amphritea balenae]RRD01170.1 LysR family transcriptional regulator [Amphritea balenae]GGK59362.1 molybdenum-dependent transcriptional regulator [Amphritea balenae]
MKLDAQLILNSEQRMFANPRRMKLLAAIAEVGSVSQGAKLSGMSYKAAWDAVRDMNDRAEQPLIELAVGGKGGGGASLTPIGERLIKLYSLLTEIQSRALKSLMDESVPLDSLLAAVTRFSAQNSARNQFIGRVTAIKRSGINDYINIELNSGLTLASEVTQRSSEKLKLYPGREVLAMIKAPSVRLLSETDVLDAGNQNIFSGTLISHSVLSQQHELIVQIATDQTICLMLELDECKAEFELGQVLNVAIDSTQILLATMDE